VWPLRSSAPGARERDGHGCAGGKRNRRSHCASPHCGRQAGAGRPRENTFLEQDLIVPSPGVAADAPLLQAARAAGITIWSEVELADRFLRDA